MGLSSKKEKPENGEDKISSLPEEVLLHILSLMPTIYAFRTNILSSRWANLWASVPNLSFCLNDGRDHGYSVDTCIFKYRNFIDRILLLHDSNIQRFYLGCNPKIDQSRVSSWISTVVKHNVRDIIVSAQFHQELRFPGSLFNCKTLERLELHRCLQFNFPSSVYLPCLKVLHVTLRTPSKELTEIFFCSPPVLEDLYLYVSDDSGRSKYNISSPALKKLCMHVHTNHLEEYNSMVIIGAPVLEVLNVFDSCHMHYNFKNISSLSKAYVDVGIIRHSHRYLRGVDSLCELLIALSNVKNVILGRSTVAAIGYAVEKKWPILPNITHLRLETAELTKNNDFTRWPAFPRVTHLQLNVMDFVSNNIANFLTLVPNLSCLVFNKVPILLSRDESADPFDEQMVPTCLLSCLKTIELCRVKGLQSELKLVKYLLGSAQVLEKMTIENCGFREVPEEKFQAEIIGMHRRSKNSQIVFV